MADNDVMVKTDALLTSPTPGTKLSIRDRIFGSAKIRPKSRVISFMDALVEVRQGSIGSLIDNRNDDESYESLLLKQIILNTYVPGTDERIFEIADFDSLKQFPIGEDWNLMIKTINELTNPDFLDKN